MAAKKQKKKVTGSNIPESVQIGGYKWTIELIDKIPQDEDGEDTYGQTLSDRRVIQLGLDMHTTEEALESTLMHEIGHAILFMSGQTEHLTEKMEEALMRALEHGYHLLYMRRG